MIIHAKVYHAKEPNFGMPAISPNPKFPEGYELVAEIPVPDTMLGTEQLDFIFHMTNSIDEHWSLNRQVKALKYDARSTSVGDIVELNGIIWICANVGWIHVAKGQPVDEIEL